MVMDPEVLTAGENLPDAEGDEAVLEADEAGGGDDTQPDPIDAQWESEPIRQRRERENIRHARKIVSLAERAQAGDAEALAQLQADPVGRRQLALLSQTVARIEATVPGAVQAQRRYEELARLQDDDPYQFTQELAKYDGLGEWFYHEYPAYLKRQARQATTAQEPRPAATGLERFVDRLLARESARGLTAAEREQLDPDNPEWEQLDPDDARAAISERFALLTARRAARERVAPVEARRQRQAELAEAVEGAIAAAPPNVSGRPGGRMSFDAARDAYLENPTPENRRKYEDARAARGW